MEEKVTLADRQDILDVLNYNMTDIEENLFEATWKTMNKATDKGFGVRKPDDPDYDFYREDVYKRQAR